jgi:hypothetical protein
MIVDSGSLNGSSIKDESIKQESQNMEVSFCSKTGKSVKVFYQFANKQNTAEETNG